MKYKAAISPATDDRRQGKSRRALRLSIELQASDGKTVTVSVRNIADQGMLIEATGAAMAIGDTIEVDLPEAGTVTGEVIWAAPPFFGCRLDSQLSSAQLAAALLKAEPTAYRVKQDSTAVDEGMVISVSEDPVPNFAKPFLIMAAFWIFVAMVVIAVV